MGISVWAASRRRYFAFLIKDVGGDIHQGTLCGGDPSDGFVPPVGQDELVDFAHGITYRRHRCIQHQRTMGAI